MVFLVISGSTIDGRAYTHIIIQFSLLFPFIHPSFETHFPTYRFSLSIDIFPQPINAKVIHFSLHGILILIFFSFLFSVFLSLISFLFLWPKLSSSSRWGGLHVNMAKGSTKKFQGSKRLPTNRISSLGWLFGSR